MYVGWGQARAAHLSMLALCRVVHSSQSRASMSMKSFWTLKVSPCTVLPIPSNVSRRFFFARDRENPGDHNLRTCSVLPIGFTQKNKSVHRAADSPPENCVIPMPVHRAANSIHAKPMPALCLCTVRPKHHAESTTALGPCTVMPCHAKPQDPHAHTPVLHERAPVRRPANWEQIRQSRPRLSPFSARKSLKSFKFCPFRSEADCRSILPRSTGYRGYSKSRTCITVGSYSRASQRSIRPPWGQCVSLLSSDPYRRGGAGQGRRGGWGGENRRLACWARDTEREAGCGVVVGCRVRL
jgi:hypothetical protein